MVTAIDAGLWPKAVAAIRIAKEAPAAILFGQGKRRPKFISMLGFIATSWSFVLFKWVLFKCWILISVSPFELSLSDKAQSDSQSDQGGRQEIK
jgi:hypothetical protein